MRRIWVLGVALGVLWGAFIGTAAGFFRLSGAPHLIYVVDDAYIHMALAKNIVAHGVYGVTPYEFSSCSSSPLWTLLLSAVYWVAGPQEMAPLVMNMVAASLLLWLVYAMVGRHIRSNGALLGVLLTVLLAGAFVAVAYTGMEHVLHTALTLLFLWLAAGSLEQPKGKGLGVGLACLLVAPLMTAARYEGCFAVLAVALVFAMRRRVLAAAAISLAGLLPIVAYGVFSVAHGAFFVPTSILAKASQPDEMSAMGLLTFCFHSLDVLASQSHLLVLVGLCGAAAVFRWRKAPLSPTGHLLLVSLLVMTLLHLQFAKTGWWFRYEAYLVALGVVTAAVLWAEELDRFSQWFKGLGRWARVLVVLLLLCVGSPLLRRAWTSTYHTPMAMTNIYQQQYQMARFIEGYYDRQSIAANDIGAICYKAEPRLLDLWGLGTLEVTRAKMAGRFDTELIRQLAARRGLRMAVVFDSWFTGNKALPKEWVCVGRWSIRNNEMCGSDTVAFYAPTREEAQRLLENLRDFAPSLPADVQRVYLSLPGAVAPAAGD